MPDPHSFDAGRLGRAARRPGGQAARWQGLCSHGRCCNSFAHLPRRTGDCRREPRQCPYRSTSLSVYQSISIKCAQGWSGWSDASVFLLSLPAVQVVLTFQHGCKDHLSASVSPCASDAAPVARHWSQWPSARSGDGAATRSERARAPPAPGTGTSLGDPIEVGAVRKAPPLRTGATARARRRASSRRDQV